MRPHAFGVRTHGVSGCDDRAHLESQRSGQAEVMAVLVQPDFQQSDGSQEVMALQYHQVDVVRVVAAAK